MTTYDPSTDAGKVRLLISDTSDPFIFSDEEINSFFEIQRLQFQSSMFFSGVGGRNMPLSPVSLLRVAALALNSIAANKARLSSIMKLLDVQLSPDKAAAALRDQARAYLEMDDEAGAFVLIEQVTTCWSFQQRFWSQVQRMQGGGL